MRCLRTRYSISKRDQQRHAVCHRYHKPQATTAENTVRCGVELHLDGLYLCMDIRSSECASTGWNSQRIGKDQSDILDNSSARACAGVGCTTVA